KHADSHTHVTAIVPEDSAIIALAKIVSDIERKKTVHESIAHSKNTMSSGLWVHRPRFRRPGKADLDILLVRDRLCNEIDGRRFAGVTVHAEWAIRPFS